MQSVLGCQNVKYDLLFEVMNILKIVGKRIQIARIMRDPKLSAEQLAEMAGVSRQTISSIENGRSKNVSFLVLQAIADALGMQIGDLLSKDYSGMSMVAESSVKYDDGAAKKKSGPPGEDAKPRLQHMRKKAG